MQDLASLIPQVYPGRQPNELDTLRASTWWSGHLSERILNNAQPVRLSHGTLIIHTTTSAWAHSLTFEAETFLEGLSRAVPGRIHKLSFRVGPMPDIPKRPEPEPQLSMAALTQLPDVVARQLARIEDDDLRETVARTAAVSLANLERSRK